jgi:rhodanese-related sulfurtransferase
MKQAWKDLGNDDFQRGFTEKEGRLLLDVRTPEEFVVSHIAGARQLAVQELEPRVGELKEYRDKPVFVYCRSGARSRKAAAILADAGFTEIYNLDTGIIGWESAGFPTEK